MFTIGLVGLPNAGKSTLFNLITGHSVPAENFPFTTIDPHDAIIAVPDPRLNTLAKISHSQKIVHACIEFRDIAGLIKNAHLGQGLGNQFLSHIREVDLILFVIRTFHNDTIVHVENRINPQEDYEILCAELCLADEKILETHISKAEKTLSKDSKAEAKKNVLQTLYSCVKKLQLASQCKTNEDEEIIRWRKSLNLLTDKPTIILANNSCDSKNSDFLSDISLDIKTEYDALNFSSDDRIALGLPKVSPIQIITTTAYAKLSLISFFTTGEKETRSWTCKKGSTALDCAGLIHSDFKKLLIRTDIVSYDDFLKYGGWNNAANAGKKTTVGKDYVVSDGDIVEFIIDSR